MSALICPNCNTPSPYGSLVCPKCHTVFNNAITTNTTFHVMSQRSRSRPEGKRLRPMDAANLGGHSMLLYIDSQDDPIVILLTSEIVFGRAASNDSSPRFDLALYGAQDFGVSRKHIIFKRTDKGVFVEDMGSANGSYLNETRVDPYTPVKIESGDRLRLGQFALEIYLPES